MVHFDLQGTKCPIRMASFSNQDLVEATDVMRTKVHLLRPSPGQPVQLTSTGAFITNFENQFFQK